MAIRKTSKEHGPSPVEAPPRSLWEGWETRLQGIAKGIVLVGIGIAIKHPALLGLALFGTGVLVLGYYFGRAE